MKSTDRAAFEARYLPAARQALSAFAIEAGTIELQRVSENVTFKVTGGADAAFVLRLHRPGYHTLAELQSERIWLRALAAAGIAVPEGLPASDGREYVPVAIPDVAEERFAGLARWTEGELLSEAMPKCEDSARLSYLKRLGAICAAMHNQASAWQPPTGFARHALDEDGLIGERPFWGPFWEHEALLPAEKALLLETRARIRTVLAGFDRSPESFSLIHADMHPHNVLVAGERLVLIDFDDTAFGWHLYDIAVALLEQSDAGDEAGKAAFVEGYRQLRGLDDRALELLPMFHLIRGMVQIGWFHQRPEHDTSAWFGEMKDRVCAQCRAFREP